MPAAHPRATALDSPQVSSELTDLQHRLHQAREALQRARAKRDQIEFEIDFYKREASCLEEMLAAAIRHANRRSEL